MATPAGWDDSLADAAEWTMGCVAAPAASMGRHSANGVSNSRQCVASARCTSMPRIKRIKRIKRINRPQARTPRSGYPRAAR